jgi:uncharacterized protein
LAHLVDSSMKKVPLEIVALSHSVTQAQNYAIVLGETNGTRRLPIIIGGYEAQAIAVAWERMVPGRPLTHDLFKNTMDTFGIAIKEIIISNLQEGIFHARLVCAQGNDVFEVDSRTSDALALAVRFNCPIFTYEFILEAAGVVLEEPNRSEGELSRTETQPNVGVRSGNSNLNQLPVEDLHKLLDQVLANEDYEQAASIRDEINKRKTN